MTHAIKGLLIAMIPGVLGLLLSPVWVGIAVVGAAGSVYLVGCVIYGYEAERRKIERGE